MQTLIGNFEKKKRKKVKQRINFKQRPRLPDNQRRNYDNMTWQNVPIDAWLSLRDTEILTLPKEKLEEIRKFPPIIRIYRNGKPLNGTRFSGYLFDIDQKKKVLVIQPLGSKQKPTEIPIDSSIKLELPVIKEKK